MTHITEYKNAGKNKTCGVELTANYKLPKFTADFNLTWMHNFEANLMSLSLGDLIDEGNKTDIDANNNTPAIMSNLVLAWQATPRLRLHTHLHFDSRQSSYNTNLVKYIQTLGNISNAMMYLVEGKTAEADPASEAAVATARDIIMRKDMPARAILTLGGHYVLGAVTLGLDVHNVLGTRYYRSGMNTNVIPQQGRWFLGSIDIRL
jgi:iron complex outermembrane receptor protein